VTRYYYLGGQRVAMRDADDNVAWLHGDHLGSTSLTTGSSGNVGARQAYYPFGATRWVTGTLPTDFGFTGQRNDGYIKLVQMGVRWYDPQLGRWISPDTIVPDSANPQSLNRFSYVFNNPLRYKDPSGYDPCEEDPTGDGCISLSNGKVIRGVQEWEVWLLAAMAYFEERQLGPDALSAATRLSLNRLGSQRDLFAGQHSLLEVLEEGGFQHPSFQELLGKVSLEQGDENLGIIQSFMQEQALDDDFEQDVWNQSLLAAQASLEGALNEPDITQGSLWFGNVHEDWLEDYKRQAGESVNVIVIYPRGARWPQGKVMVLNSSLSVVIPGTWLTPNPTPTPGSTPASF
jgi:RHS repeat-associated protein